MPKYFKVTPKHWWSYLNPFWWRTKRVVEMLVNNEYEKCKPDIDKAIQNVYIHGTGMLQDYKHVDYTAIWKEDKGGRGDE